MDDARLNIRSTFDIEELKRNADRYRKELSKMGTVTDREGYVISSAWARMKQAAGAYLTLDIVKRIAQTRGEFQSLNVAFTTMLGDGARAQQLMAESVELAAKTPFTLQEVAKGAKQLLAYGFAADEITDTLRRLGDVASALNLPMERLTYLYGTTATQGRLYARDMIQFTTSGIPVLQELATMYGKTTEEINTMVTDGKIGFDNIKKVFENMTNEGGKFYNLMEEISKTITGKISNLSDAIQTMFDKIGQANEETINGAIDGAKYLVENYEAVLSILKVLVATYGTYKASLIAVAAAQRVSITIQNISAWLSLAKTIRTAKDAQIAFNLATKANPYILLATVIIGVGTALYQFTKKTDSAKEALKQFNDEAERQTEKYKNLISIAQDESKAIYERQQALEELKRIYPTVFKNMDLEAIKTTNQTKLTNELAKAERERQKAQRESNIKNLEENIRTEEKYLKMYQKQSYDRDRDTNIERAKKRITEFKDQLKGEQEIYKQITSEIKSQEEAEKRAAEEARKREEAAKKTVKWYDDEIKAIKDLQEKSSTNQEYQKYQNQIDTLKRAREKITEKEDKELKKQAKIRQEINQSIIENDLKLQQERLSILEDGRTKQLAEVDLEAKQKLAAINKEQEELARKYKEAGNGNLPESVIKTYNLRRENIESESAKKRFDIEYHYNTETEKFYEQLTDVFLTEEELKTKAVQERYDEMRKAAREEYNNEVSAINATKKGIEAEKAVQEALEKYNEKTTLIDSAQEKEELKAEGEAMREYLKKYGTFQQQRLAITQEYAEKIKQAQYEGQKALLKKEEEKALKELDQSMIEKSDLWIKLFSRSSDMSKRQIHEVLVEAKKLVDYLSGATKEKPVGFTDEQLNSLQGDVEKIKALYDGINEKQEELDKRNNYPFSGIINGFKGLKKSAETYNKALGEVDENKKKALLSQAELEKQKGLNYLKEGAIEAANGIVSLTEKMKELAELTGDSKFSQFADEMNSLASNLQAAGQGAQSGGWIGAVIGGATNMIEQTFSSILQAKASEEEYLQNHEDFINALKLQDLKLKDEDYESFGAKGLQKAIDAAQKAKEAMREYEEEVTKQTIPNIEKEFKSLGAAIFAPIFGSFGFGKRISNETKTVLEAYRKGYTDLQAMTIKTKDRSGWANFWGKKDKYMALKDLAPQLWDEKGEFNVDNAKLFLETNTQINDSQRKQIQNVIDLKEQYNDLIDIVDEQIDNTFGDIATSLTDAIWEGVLNGADVWDKFEDIGLNVIQTMGKELVNSLLIGSYLDKFKEKMRNAYLLGDQKDVQKEITNILTDIKKGLPSIINSATDLTTEFLDYAKQMGWDVDRLKSEGELKSQTGTISKTITEQTASEMMGIWRGQYDVTKGIQTEVISLHADWKNAINVTNNYLSNIANNTYTTANNTSVLADVNDTLIRMDGRLVTLERNSNKKYALK